MSSAWSLYNSKTKELRENLSLDEFRGFFQKLKPDDQRFWFGWDGRRDTWEPALDLLQEMERPDLDAKNHEPVLKSSFVEMEYHQTKPTLPKADEEIAVSGFDRRRYPRYQAHFRVIIKNDNLTFRTFSKDVSLGGLSLETAVPPGFMGPICQMHLGNSATGENLEFSVKMLVTRFESRYFSFIKCPPESLARLQQWLAACEPLKRVG